MDQQRQQPSPLNLIAYLKNDTPSPGKPAETQQTGVHHAQPQGERSASSSTAFQYRSSAGERSQRVLEIGGRHARQTSLHGFEQTSHSSIAYNYPNLSNSMEPFFGFTDMFGGPGDSTTYSAPVRDHLPKSFHEANNIASSSNVQPSIFDYPTPSMIASLPVPVLPMDPSSANSLPFDLNIPQHEISDDFLPPPSGTNEMPVPGREDLRSVPRKYPALYSETGFDLISVLSRMANRPNPQIDIGPVDLSCSFLVVDANQYDFPIVYVSPTFSKLTNYAEEEIMGRNCRFLQSPDGHVVKGSRRRYTDNAAVHHMQTHIVQRKESQSSLINYRKGGQPFINLVTIIPVLGDNNEVMFFVGLQIDLVEQPNAILARMRNGTYTVNYSLKNIPPNFPAAASTNEQNDPYLQQASEYQVLPFPATAEIVSLMGGPPTDSEAAKRIWSRMLLHNCVDVVYVLSLKGTFLYCSPAVRRLLQFDPEELVGRNFSSVCHPLDVVPVTRELKHASSGSPGFVDTVSFVFRIRRKLSGYMWLEAEGNLHFDQGKSRKFFIMSGRPRPVYSLSRFLLKSNSTTPTGGNMELWAKLSLDGLYLYASSAAQSLFGIPAEELANTSMYQYFRADRTTDLTRALSQARRGDVVTLRHNFQNRRGQFVDVVTTFWPNDMAQSSSMTGKDSTGRLPSGKSGATSNAPLLTAPRERALPISAEFSSAQGFSNEDTMSNQLAVNPSTPLSSCSFFICQTREYSAADGSEPTTQDTQMQDFPNENNDDNVFDLLETVRGTSWQFELHQLRLENKKMKDEIEENLLARKKKKKRRNVPVVVTTCAHCHCEASPEWRKGPTGPRSLCNACGLKYARTQSVLPTEPEDAEARRSEEMENEDTEI